MDISRMKSIDWEEFKNSYPAAYNFMVRRINQREREDLTTKRARGFNLTSGEVKRLEELNQLL